MKLRSSAATKTTRSKQKCVFWPRDLSPLISSLHSKREEEEEARFFLLGWCSLGGGGGVGSERPEVESLFVVSALKCPEDGKSSSSSKLIKTRAEEIDKLVEAEHHQALSRVHTPEAASSSSPLTWNKLRVVGTVCSGERVELEFGLEARGEKLVQHKVGGEVTFQSVDSAAQVITYSYDRSELFSRICPDVELEGPSTREEGGLQCLERISQPVGKVSGNSQRAFSLAQCICSLNESCLYRPWAEDVEQIWNEDALRRLSVCISQTPKASLGHFQGVGFTYFPMFLWNTLRGGGGGSVQAAEARPTTFCSLHFDYVKKADRKMAVIVGRLLGLALSIWVLNHRNVLQDGALSHLEKFKNDVILKVTVTVLEGAPGGLKLYEDLSHFFGFTTRLAIGAVRNEKWLPTLVEHSVTLISILSGAFGLKTGLSFLADLLLVVTVPYIALYYAYSFVFRCHLRLSGATYLLFRGRGREQENSRLSKTFFLEHVIVGILLLTPLLFLLPTVFVYYLFWALIFLALKIILLGIQLLMVASELFPLASIWLRYWKPDLFRKSVYLEHEDSGTKSASLPSSRAVALAVAFSHKEYLHLAFENVGEIFTVLVSEILSDLKRILLGETLPFLQLVKCDL